MAVSVPIRGSINLTYLLVVTLYFSSSSFRPHQGINKFNLSISTNCWYNWSWRSFRPHQGINKFNNS